MAYRGCGKTYVFCSYVCWRALLDPDVKVLIVSAGRETADDISKFIKRLISEIPVLQHLKARKKQHDSNVSFDFGPAIASKDPSVKSLGITSQLSGSRADIILADDIEVPNNSGTQMMRDKLEQLVTEFDSIIKPGGEVTFLGTPQCEESLYIKLAKKGFDCRIWTARVPADVEKYEGRLAPFITDLVAKRTRAGSPVDPRRFDEDELLGREARMGRSNFALQYMLDTSLSDANRYPLKIADLVIMDVDPRLAPTKLSWCNDPDKQHKTLDCDALKGDRPFRPMWVSPDFAPFEGGVMAIDPSGRGDDETAYAVVKACNGMLYLTASGGFAGGHDDETLMGLVQIAMAQGVNCVLIEENFGSGMYAKVIAPWFARNYPVAIEEVNVRGQKEARIIETLEPVMNQHRLVVDTRVFKSDHDNRPAPRKGLFHQLTRITKDRGSLAHDDRIDALSNAVAYWADAMARDTDRAADEARERALDEELEQFMEHTLGVKPAGNRWFRV